MDETWRPLEGTLAEVLQREPRPFPALAEGRIPAVVIRNAFPVDQCREGVRRLYDEAGILERPGQAYDAVGTSLVNLGADRERFFASARETHALFARVFHGLQHPVGQVYELLARLASDRMVLTAREPDGRQYGPAIFRLYPAGKGHPPHFDSLRLREGWSHYTVSRFEHQFAAVLCLQASDDPGDGEAILHRHFWTPEIQAILDEERFAQFAAEHRVPNTKIRLEAGDFYVFNPRNIHEVPLIQGVTPRIVLATFLGFSNDDPEVLVWS